MRQFCISQKFTFKYLLKAWIHISFQYKHLCIWSQVNTCLNFNIHTPDASPALTAGLKRRCKYIYIIVAFYIQIPILFQSFQHLSPTIEVLNVPQIPWITRVETPVQAVCKSKAESLAAWYDVNDDFIYLRNTISYSFTEMLDLLIKRRRLL